MSRMAAEIVKFKGFNLESDAFTESMGILERDRSHYAKIVNTAADMMLGGGAKRALIVVAPLARKWLMSGGNLEKLLDRVPELSEPAMIGGSRFIDMMGKIIAKGIITDIYESPYSYRRVIEPEIFAEFEKISQERGRQKLRNMLERRGIAKNHANRNRKASATMFTVKDIKRAANKARVRFDGKGQGGSRAVPGYTWFIRVPGITITRSNTGEMQLKTYDDGSPATLTPGDDDVRSIEGIDDFNSLVVALKKMKQDMLDSHDSKKVSNRIDRIASRVAAGLDDSIGDQFLAREDDVVQAIRKVFGNVRVKNAKSYSTDASFLMETANRAIVVKLTDTNKRRQKLSVWASIVGRRDGLSKVVNFTGFENMGRLLIKASDELLTTLIGYDALTPEGMKEMERASQLDNEAFARHISSVVDSGLSVLDGAGNSDVGTDNRFWFQVDVKTDNRPVRGSKSGKIYIYHNKPVMEARSVAARVDKIIQKEEWSFVFGNVERVKRAKVVRVDPYNADKKQWGNTVDVYYNNTLHMEVQISG
jgi:predicted transcriptional regulator